MESIGRSPSNVDHYLRSEDHILASMHIDREGALCTPIHRKRQPQPGNLKPDLTLRPIHQYSQSRME